MNICLSRGEKDKIINPDQFIVEMSNIITEVQQNGLALDDIGIGDLLNRVLKLCYFHRVKLESNFVSVVIAIGILEGLGRRLDPEIDILKLATPYILQASINSL